ncbi:MAG: hypothetical protein F6J94_11515 [Moorea sp. SIO1F2]|uniref:hypothetical protein n=1 Tax=Moorena sp. SIO1F2 TaxID=2607819 RepID=UPI0013B91FAF|nr:hypothetical protein [Moorena sp. SIO1F2]NET82533.1 hypothetical protein [Moorena sp. SIO1F2]
MPEAGNRQDACSEMKQARCLLGNETGKMPVPLRCPRPETGKMPVPPRCLGMKQARCLFHQDAHATKLLKLSRIYSTTYSEDIDTSSKAVLVNFCMHGSCLGRSAISIPMLPPTPRG